MPLVLYLPAAHGVGSGHCHSYRQSVFVTLENKTSQLTVLSTAKPHMST